jgi:hypothetical protein
MLQRYDEEMVFLDATYRTTKYALPLFFLCVHANSGYYVVGAFVTQREDSQSISEELSHIRGTIYFERSESIMEYQKLHDRCL